MSSAQVSGPVLLPLPPKLSARPARGWQCTRSLDRCSCSTNPCPLSPRNTATCGSCLCTLRPVEEEEAAPWQLRSASRSRRPRGRPPEQPASSRSKAKRHLWMHFTRMGAYADARGPGDRARRGLLRLRRARQALPRRARGALLRERRPRPRGARRGGGARRRRSSASTSTGATRTRRAIELAARIAALAPGDLNRVFFTSGGSEAVESAWKLARAYHRLNGEGQRHKLISRKLAYHGTIARGARRHRADVAAHAVRAAHAGRRATSRTRTATAGRRTATRSGRRTRSRRRSSSRARRRSPP